VQSSQRSQVWCYAAGAGEAGPLVLQVLSVIRAGIKEESAGKNSAVRCRQCFLLNLQAGMSLRAGAVAVKQWVSPEAEKRQNPAGQAEEAAGAVSRQES